MFNPFHTWNYVQNSISILQIVLVCHHFYVFTPMPPNLSCLPVGYLLLNTLIYRGMWGFIPPKT